MYLNYNIVCHTNHRYIYIFVGKACYDFRFYIDIKCVRDWSDVSLSKAFEESFYYFSMQELLNLRNLQIPKFTY